MKKWFFRLFFLLFLCGLVTVAAVYWYFSGVQSFASLNQVERLKVAKRYFSFSLPRGYDVQFAATLGGRRQLLLNGSNHSTIRVETFKYPGMKQQFLEIFKNQTTIDTSTILDDSLNFSKGERLPSIVLSHIQDFKSLKGVQFKCENSATSTFLQATFMGIMDDNKVRKTSYAIHIDNNSRTGFSIIFDGHRVIKEPQGVSQFIRSIRVN